MRKTIVWLVAAVAMASLVMPTPAQSPVRTSIGAIVSDLERRNAADESRAARSQFLFLQQQQVLALNRLASVQSASCGGGSTGNATVDAMIAADRTFAMQQQVKAQQETAAATRALYKAIEDSSLVRGAEQPRIFEMTESTYRTTGLANLSKQQISELDTWFKANRLGIRIVQDRTYGIVRPDQQ